MKRNKFSGIMILGLAGIFMFSALFCCCVNEAAASLVTQKAADPHSCCPDQEESSQSQSHEDEQCGCSLSMKGLKEAKADALPDRILAGINVQVPDIGTEHILLTRLSVIETDVTDTSQTALYLKNCAFRL